MDGVFGAFTYIEGVPQLESFVSDDGTKFAAVAVMDGTQTQLEVNAAAVPVSERMEKIEGAEVTVGGDAQVSSTITKIAKKDAARAEMIAAPIALLALILLLGGFRVGMLPLLAAGSAILLTTVVFVFGELFTTFTTFAMSITSLFGIGLGIDYGLLIVARFREELAAGRNPSQAVARTVNSAGRTVMFSAATVAISMCGLFFLPGSMNRSFAAAGLFVTLIVAAVSVIFLPPLLGIMWRRVTPKAEETSDGWFGQVARRVQDRPVLVAGAITLGCLILASPILGMKTSLIDEKFMPPSSDARIAAETLAGDFSGLSANPIQVVAETEASKPAPKAPEIQTGLIPIDTVNNIIEEMSRLHRERTEAIERAARAEERERFQAERRRTAEEHLEEVQRLHREAEQAREAARQADLPPPDIGHGGPELSSDSREDGEEASVPMSATVSEAPSGKRPGRVRSAWRVLWATNPQENDPPPQGPPGQMAEHGEEGPGGAHGM